MSTESYLSEFHFVGSSIKKVSIKNDFVSLDNFSNLKKKLDISHQLGLVNTNDSGEIIGTIILNVKLTLSQGKNKYMVDVAIEGCFSSLQVDEAKFVEMMKVNGIAALYSIARAFIISTSSQTLSSGSITLPMFNVAAYCKDLDEEKNKSNNDN